MFNKSCRWLDSNQGTLVLEATALPTAPQPLPGSIDLKSILIIRFIYSGCRYAPLVWLNKFRTIRNAKVYQKLDFFWIVNQIRWQRHPFRLIRFLWKCRKRYFGPNLSLSLSLSLYLILCFSFNSQRPHFPSKDQSVVCLFSLLPHPLACQWNTRPLLAPCLLGLECSQGGQNCKTYFPHKPIICVLG